MRIAFLYGKFSLGARPFDFDALYTAPRGLTGSELSCIEYARAMAARGHDVLLIVGQPLEPRTWYGVNVSPLVDPNAVADYDAVLSWNEPNLVFEVPPGPLRVVNQQLNDFAYCRPGWEGVVDLVTSPSARHLEYLKHQAPSVADWAVLPNGCDPTLYELDDDARRTVAGRVVWASSADRGLHRLLEMWPRIKRAVPHATLRCFYHFEPAHFDDYEQIGPNVHPDLLEIAQRKRYVRYAMEKLSAGGWGVEHVGSVSRHRMAEEWERAEVLAYPCDTIRFTEGFSVTTLEACASGALPVITDTDALGQIYGDVAPMTKLSDSDRFDAQAQIHFSDLVIEGLTNHEWRRAHVARCRALAVEHSWGILAERLENILLSRLRCAPVISASRRSSAAEAAP
jgi:glycosyltransferase involved in cell wall biosynthesis